MKRELERYLWRATRGLYGAARKDVWNELEQDILERVRVSRAFGLSEAQALNRALEQLGDPRVVSAGMAKTYVWPLALKLSVLGAVGAALLLTLPSAAKSVLSTTTPLSVQTGAVFVPEDTLLRALEQQGIGLSTQELRTDPYRDEVNKLLPPGAQIVESDSAPYVFDDIPQTSLDYLVRVARSKNYAVQVAGWKVLEVRVGAAQLVLNPYPGQNDFASLYSERFFNQLAVASGLLTQGRNTPLQAPAREAERVRIVGTRLEWVGRVLVVGRLQNVLPPEQTGYLVGMNRGQGLTLQVPRLDFSTRAVQVGPDGRFELIIPAGPVGRLSGLLPPVRAGTTGQPKLEDTQGLYFSLYNETAFGQFREFTDLPPTVLPSLLESGKTYTL